MRGNAVQQKHLRPSGQIELGDLAFPLLRFAANHLGTRAWCAIYATTAFPQCNDAPIPAITRAWTWEHTHHHTGKINAALYRKAKHQEQNTASNSMAALAGARVAAQRWARAWR
jgi:hypothetical protein